MSGRESRIVGVVVGGSLTKSLDVRLDAGVTARLGEYVIAPLEGESVLIGMVTDVLLKSAESGPTAWPPPAGNDPSSELLRDVLLDTGVYSAVEVTPYLEVAGAGDTARARSLPRHFAPVRTADQETIDAAFTPGDRASINLGAPLGMESVEVCVDIEKLFERSAGIFGKSGTGKTVVALQVLDAMVANSARQPTGRDKTVALIFDMHNDYGRELKFEGAGGGRRRSLKQLHASDVAVYTLEDGVTDADSRIVIGTRDIQPEDLDVLQSASDMTGPALDAAYLLRDRLKGSDWFDLVLADDPPPSLVRELWAGGEEPEDLNWSKVAGRLGIHSGSFDNLRRTLRKVRRPAFVESGSGQFSSVLNHVVQTLQGGMSVVVQFGRHGNDLMSYMLVANMLSRRIWDEYREAKDRAGSDASKEPNRLVIVIEEAHKFVDKSLSGQTIFGQIARELRKYNVTLLVIDQRPSQIDSEVLSQVGTKFCLQLDSEADVEALLGGVAGRAGLRQVIASLESQQQALVFGHALPMPVVLRPPTLDATARPGASLRDRLTPRHSSEAEPADRPLTMYGRRPGVGT